jgi:hypothetical protein
MESQVVESQQRMNMVMMWGLIGWTRCLKLSKQRLLRILTTVEVEPFFNLLKATEETLREHIEVTLHAFVTRLIAIKSNYFLSNNCYNELLKLVSDIHSKPHKVPKDMYQSKKLKSAIGLKYEKTDVYPENCMLLWKEHVNKKKCLECGQSRFIEFVAKDDEKVMIEVVHKQLHYIPITPNLK